VLGVRRNASENLVKSYKDLTVWQKSVSLSLSVYKMTNRFPDAEKFGLTGQIRRAATSIPANIAEGWGRGSTKEYIQFLLVGRGSLMELDTHVLIAHRLGYLAEDQFDTLQKSIEEIGMMLNGLIRALKARHLGSKFPRSNT
jgi:four helix bundle protein